MTTKRHIRDKVLSNLLPVFIFCVAVILTVSCKEKDNRLPFLNVESPAEGSQLQACDELIVSGVCSDEGGLSQALIRLDYSGSELQTVIFDGEIEGTFSVRLKAGDRYLPGGLYKLVVTVSDLSGNTNSDFTDLFITELPLELSRITLASEDTQGNCSFYSRAAGENSFTAVGPLLTDYIDLRSDSRDQALLLLRSGSFQALDPLNLSPLFSQTLANLSSFDNNNRDYVIGASSSPYLRRIKSSGADAGTYPDIIEPVTAVYLSEEGIYIGNRDLPAFSYSINLINRSQNTLIGNSSSDYQIDQILSGGKQQILTFGNENGQMRYAVYDSITLQIEATQTIGETFISATNGPNKVFVLTDAGLRQWDAGTGQLSGIWISGTYTALAYEKQSGEIWLAGINEIRRYNLNGQLTNTETGSFGEVAKISFLYNK